MTIGGTEDVFCRLMGLAASEHTATLQRALDEQPDAFGMYGLTVGEGHGGPVAALIEEVSKEHQPSLKEIAETNERLLALLDFAPFMPVAYGKVTTVSDVRDQLTNLNLNKIGKATELIHGRFEIGINYYDEREPEADGDQSESRNYLRRLKSHQDATTALQGEIASHLEKLTNADDQSIIAFKKLVSKNPKIVFRAGVLLDRSSFDQSQLHSTLRQIVSDGEVDLQITGPFLPMSFVPGLADL